MNRSVQLDFLADDMERNSCGSTVYPGSETGSETGGDAPVLNRSPKSSMIQGGLPVLSYRERETETGLSHPVPVGEEESIASLSSLSGHRGRAEEPAGGEKKAENHQQTEKPPPTLRPYQLEAISRIQAEFERGIRRTLLVLPTGCGKTVVFAELARRFVSRGTRALVLAHRTELLTQAQSKLAAVGVWAELEKAERRAGIASVVVASVQTLQRKRLEQFAPDEFGLVVVDEGHHAPATSYRNVLERFTGALVLLVTATPDRADGKALGEICESVAYQYELRDAIREEWLVPIRARRIVVEGVDLSKVHSRAGDLANDELSAVMATDEAVLGVVVPLLDEAGDRRTIVFAVSVEHAYALASALRDRRAACARVAHGGMDADERERILADFKRGDFQFLVNVALFTEGFDEPSVACVAIARPTKSRALFVQMVGRGTRMLGLSMAESRENGKPDCLVLDFTGNAGKHRLVGPLDALAAGEDVSDELRAEAQRLLEHEQCELDGVLDAAQKLLEEKRRAWRQSARANYFAHDVDPFFGEEMGPPINAPWAQDPATPEQVRMLADIGMKKIPPNITRGEVVRILEADRARRKAGLATYKQSALLRRQLGIDARTLTKAQASARIGILAECDWDSARAAGRIRLLEQQERGDAYPLRRSDP